MLVISDPASVTAYDLGTVRVQNTAPYDRQDVVTTTLPLHRGELFAGQRLAASNTGTGTIEVVAWKRWVQPYDDGSERVVQITFPVVLGPYSSSYPFGSIDVGIERSTRGVYNGFGLPAETISRFLRTRITAFMGANEIDLYPAPTFQLLELDYHRQIWRTFTRWPNTPMWAEMDIQFLNGMRHARLFLKYGCSNTAWNENNDPDSTVMVWKRKEKTGQPPYMRDGTQLEAGAQGFTFDSSSATIYSRYTRQRWPDPDIYPVGNWQGGKWVIVTEADYDASHPETFTLRDGQAVHLAGALLFEKQPDDIDDLILDTFQAERVGPVVACSTRWQDVPEACGPHEHVPRVRAGWFASTQAMHERAESSALTYESAERRAGSSYGGYADFRNVWAAFNAAGATARWYCLSETQSTGDQNCYGLDGCHDVMMYGWPRSLISVASGRLRWGWPQFHRENDGRWCTVDEHPKHNYWHGSPYAVANSGYRTKPSIWCIDMLGKENHQYHGMYWKEDGRADPESQKWSGKDDQHDDDRWSLAFTLVSGHDLERQIIEQDAERWCFEYCSLYTIEGHDCRGYDQNDQPNVRNGFSYGGRALGRSFLTASRLYWLTQNPRLRKRILGRIKGRIASWATWSAPQYINRDIEGDRSIDPNSNYLPLYPCWITWEDGIAVTGLWSLWKVMRIPELLDQAKRMARALALYAWHSYDGGATYVAAKGVRIDKPNNLPPTNWADIADWNWHNNTNGRNNNPDDFDVYLENDFDWWMLPSILLGEQWAKTYRNGAADIQWLQRCQVLRRQLLWQQYDYRNTAPLMLRDALKKIPWFSAVSDPVSMP